MSIAGLFGERCVESSQYWGLVEVPRATQDKTQVIIGFRTGKVTWSSDERGDDSVTPRSLISSVLFMLLTLQMVDERDRVQFPLKIYVRAFICTKFHAIRGTPETGCL